MKTQIWIAVSVYVLVAIVKKRLDLDASLYTLVSVRSGRGISADVSIRPGGS